MPPAAMEARAAPAPDLPLPPVELRRTVGPVEPAFYANEHGGPVFGDEVEPAAYERVLDFGCGCGRNARQLLQMRAPPLRYVGYDLYRPSIQWAQAHLARPGWEFRHLNVLNIGLNPTGSARVPFDVDETFTLINAHSVFTHIVEEHVRFYFDECVRHLAPHGVMRLTWFFFNKAALPMMQDFQNCLYINADDPTNATIYDLDFVRRLYRDAGLRIVKVVPPGIRGFQWVVIADRSTGPDAEFPEDAAPIGICRPPA